MAAIETEGLTRRFGDVVAVDGIDLSVHDGEVFGFLGPNGAGKSTTINVLLGFTRPTSGTGRVLGRDIVGDSLGIRRRTGVLPENFGVYDRLTARKHLRFAIDTKGADDDPDALLERVGLAAAGDRRAGGFSTGMKQRLALAMALTGDPELLILDEPSTGLDPNGAREMRSIVREEVERGTTVFFSSHIMEQVEAVCNRVGILREGRLVAEDSIEALKDSFDADAQLVVSVDTVPDGAVEELEGLANVTGVRVEGTDIVASLSADTQKADVIRVLEEAGATVEDITSEDASLEDLFAAFTQGDAGVAHP